MSLIRVFRSVFGLRYCRATSMASEPPRVYGPRDLDLDLRLYPGVRAISGHPLRPYVDYGRHEERLRWITMLREPNERLFSHYRYYCARHAVAMTFEEWCRERGERAADLQVRWIAGTPDLARAKELLATRFVRVGDQDDFDTSLALFAPLMATARFPTSVGWVENRSGASLEPSDRELAGRYNELDLALYEFFRTEIWPRQLDEAPPVAPRPYEDTIGCRLRRHANLAYHGVVYKNVKRVSAMVSERRGSRPPLRSTRPGPPDEALP